MARLKLEFPEPVIFSTVMDVRVDDVNYAGHVSNDRYLTIAHEARIRFFRALGFKDESSIEGNVGIIVADAAVVYKSELFMGDRLKIEMSIAGENKYGFDLFYRIKNMTKDKISAIIKTGVISYNFPGNKITAFPSIFREKLENLKLEESTH